jgi:predicted kinase
MQCMTTQTGRQPATAGGLVIVCGLPGSGKTTVARQLAAARPGVRLGPDEWMAALGVNVWDATMRARVEALQWTVAKDLLTAGATVVLEWGTWARAERDALREQARALGASVELRFLDVPAEELWRRVAGRAAEDPPIRRQDLDEWIAVFQRPDPDELALYDVID